MGQLLKAKISVNEQILNVRMCRLPYVDTIMQYKVKISTAFLLFSVIFNTHRMM
jgi:hypothetical protein